MSVKMRQKVEREIAVAVIKALLAAGYSLGVNDGEETTIHHSTDAKAIENAMFTTDEDWLLVFDKENTDHTDERGDWWVRFIYGNDGWDVINDYCTALEEFIGEGTPVQKLIDEYSD